MGYHGEYGSGTITLEEWKRLQEETPEKIIVRSHKDRTDVRAADND